MGICALGRKVPQIKDSDYDYDTYEMAKQTLKHLSDLDQKQNSQLRKRLFQQAKAQDAKLERFYKEQNEHKILFQKIENNIVRTSKAKIQNNKAKNSLRAAEETRQWKQQERKYLQRQQENEEAIEDLQLDIEDFKREQEQRFGIGKYKQSNEERIINQQKKSILPNLRGKLDYPDFKKLQFEKLPNWKADSYKFQALIVA